MIKVNPNFDHYGLDQHRISSYHPKNKRSFPKLQANKIQCRPSRTFYSCHSSNNTITSRKGISLSKHFTKNFDKLYGEQVWRSKETDEDWSQKFRRKESLIKQRNWMEKQKQRISLQQKLYYLNKTSIQNYFRRPLEVCQLAKSEVRVIKNKKKQSQINRWNYFEQQKAIRRSNSSRSSSFFSTFTVPTTNDSYSAEVSVKKDVGSHTFSEYFRGSLIDELSGYSSKNLDKFRA